MKAMDWWYLLNGILGIIGGLLILYGTKTKSDILFKPKERGWSQPRMFKNMFGEDKYQDVLKYQYYLLIFIAFAGGIVFIVAALN